MPVAAELQYATCSGGNRKYLLNLPARCQHLRPNSSFQCTPLLPCLRGLMDSCRPRNHGCFHTHACQTVCLLRMHSNCMSVMPIKLPCVVFSPKLLISHVPVVRNCLYYRSVNLPSGLGSVCLARHDQFSKRLRQTTVQNSRLLFNYCFCETCPTGNY